MEGLLAIIAIIGLGILFFMFLALMGSRIR